MGKPLDPAKEIGVAVVWFEHDLGDERGRSAALTGYAEFFFEIGADMPDRGNDDLIFHIPSL